MANVVISDNLKDEVLKFLKKIKKADLITTYLYFLEKKFNIKPVLFAREKTIYQSQDDLIQRLEKEGKLWRADIPNLHYFPNHCKLGDE